MRFINLSKSLLVATATLLGGATAFAQIDPNLVCSSEGACACSNGGTVSCNSSGGNSCPAGQTPFCTAAPEVTCIGVNNQPRTDLTCFQTGTPPSGNDCRYVANIDITNTGNNLSFNYIDNLGGLPGCLHANVGGCIFLSSQTPLPNPMPWIAALNRFETEDEYRGHYFRGCLVGSLPANPPHPALPVSQWPNYGFNLGSQGITSDFYAGAGYPYMIFDANCNFQGFASNYNTIANRCGGIDVYTRSPISLIFDDSYDFERNVAIVSFPIEPNGGSKLYSWKASQQTPLLVYDPEHKGQITSAHQLFGNWTFGGQRLASLVGGSVSTTWRNGFEALASLDSNGDKKVSGPELRNLALWFDANQNGVSEEGEVQSLEQHGVQELYYTTDRSDSETKSVYATRGFLRIVDGRESIGTSVDWYSSANSGVGQFLNELVPLSTIGNKQEDSGLSEEPQYLSANKHSSISGRWQWKAANASEATKQITPRGVFYIGESAPGHFLLSSVNYLKSDSGAKAKYFGAGFEVMTGTIDANGTIKFGSQYDSPFIYRSNAILQSDGKTIEGETVASGRLLNGRAGSIKYHWTATKVD